jgi:hypothetical protein
MEGEIIKKANKYGIVLFWPRPLKAEIRVRIPVSLPKPAQMMNDDWVKAGL